MKNKKTHKFLSILLGFCFCLCPFLSIPLKEEKASALATSEYSIYDYEWANYFNFDNIDKEYVIEHESTSTIDISFGVDSNFHDCIFLTFKKTTTSNSSDFLIDLDESNISLSSSVTPDILQNTRYFFSCKMTTFFEGSYVDFRLRTTLADGTKNSWTFDYNNSTTTGDFSNLSSLFNAELDLRITSQGGVPQGTVFCISDIMLNVGDSIAPVYTPYFYSLESLPDIPDNPDNPGNPDVPDNPNSPLLPISSFFYNVDIDFTVLLSNGTTQTLSNVPVYYVLGGLSFTPYKQYILANVNGTVSGVSVTMTFASWVFGFNFHVQGIGNVDAFSQQFTLGLVPTDILGNSIVARFRNFPIETMVGFGIQTLNVDISEYKVTSIQNWTIYDIDNLTDLVLLDYTSNYNAGFENGRNQGYEEGLSEAESLLKDRWLEQGYNNGYADGVADDNDFLALSNAIASVPVTLLTSIFDFNILGFNMKTVMFGLLSAVIVFAIIMFFTKGKNE